MMLSRLVNQVRIRFGSPPGRERSQLFGSTISRSQVGIENGTL